MERAEPTLRRDAVHVPGRSGNELRASVVRDSIGFASISGTIKWAIDPSTARSCADRRNGKKGVKVELLQFVAGSVQTEAAHFIMQCSNTHTKALCSFFAVKLAGFQCNDNRIAFAFFHSFGQCSDCRRL